MVHFKYRMGKGYFFAEASNKKTSNLICNRSAAVMKECNIGHYYETIYLNTFKIVGKVAV